MIRKCVFISLASLEASLTSPERTGETREPDSAALLSGQSDSLFRRYCACAEGWSQAEEATSQYFVI